jgi:hypothetical protein
MRKHKNGDLPHFRLQIQSKLCSFKESKRRRVNFIEVIQSESDFLEVAGATDVSSRSIIVWRGDVANTFAAYHNYLYITI